MSDSQRSLRDMRDYILSFSLDNLSHGSQGYQRVLLQLVGLTGHGKSALINSCKCVLDDREFLMYAEATAGPPVTFKRTAYELTPTISIVDNRPIMGGRREDMAEMYAQLGNFRPLDETVNKNWTFDDYMSLLEDTDLEPNYTDLTVPVLVHGAHISLCSEDLEEMKVFLRNAKLMTGIVPIVVLTHKARQSTYEMENKFRAMGAEQITLVENYTTKNHERTRTRDTDILTFLYNALQDVAYHMSHPQDLRRDRVKRKKFLLSYMHDVEVEIKVDRKQGPR